MVRLGRSPLVEPWKGQPSWCQVRTNADSVLTYSCGSDGPKRQGSPMHPPTRDDYFLNHRDQPERVGRYAAIVGKARGWNCLSPDRVTELVHQCHFDVGGTDIDAAAECAHDGFSDQLFACPDFE